MSTYTTVYKSTDESLIEYYNIIMKMPNSSKRKLAAEKYNYIMDNKNNLNGRNEQKLINELGALINADLAVNNEMYQKLKVIFNKYLNVGVYDDLSKNCKSYEKDVYYTFKNFIYGNWFNKEYPTMIDLLNGGGFLPKFLTNNNDYVNSTIQIAAQNLEKELTQVFGERTLW